MSRDGYHAAVETLALRDRTNDRRRLLVSGPDHVKFLHNLMTNDVRRLAVGRGCEAFVTSPQGKTLAFVSLLAQPERILLRTEPPGFDALLAHLEKYGLFDDVRLEDVTSSTVELHLVGPEAGPRLEALGLSLPTEPGSATEGTLRGESVRIVAEALTGRPGWTLLAGDGAGSTVIAAVRGPSSASDLVELDEPTWNALRIEGGTPLSGSDVTSENLPQEVGRDAQAISFVKGCYLGQETVARIDALGHVNRFLRGLTINARSIPDPSGELVGDGKVVGRVTSSAFSPGWDGVVALGYIRATHAGPGTVLSLGPSTAVVRALPMLPGA